MHVSCIHLSTNYSLCRDEERLVGLSSFRGKSEHKRYTLIVLLYSVISPHAR
nr:MAG TPA: hypothetical protein [Caudoviricetes sp.]